MCQSEALTNGMNGNGQNIQNGKYLDTGSQTKWNRYIVNEVHLWLILILIRCISIIK